VASASFPSSVGFLAFLRRFSNLCLVISLVELAFDALDEGSTGLEHGHGSGGHDRAVPGMLLLVDPQGEQLHI
jgi:hypothetical protein